MINFLVFLHLVTYFTMRGPEPLPLPLPDILSPLTIISGISYYTPEQ